jgi:hypothetical protein
MSGSCQCGVVKVDVTTAGPVALRACACSFCRKHGARTFADRHGHATVAAADLVSYVFGLRTAAFLHCPTCHAYIGAAIPAEGGSARMTISANLFPVLDGCAAAVVDYSGESATERVARRLDAWTPSTFPAAGPDFTGLSRDGVA